MTYLPFSHRFAICTLVDRKTVLIRGQRSAAHRATSGRVSAPLREWSRERFSPQEGCPQRNPVLLHIKHGLLLGQAEAILVDQAQNGVIGVLPVALQSLEDSERRVDTLGSVLA